MSRRPPHPWLGPAWLLAASLAALGGVLATGEWVDRHPRHVGLVAPTLWPLLALGAVLPVGTWLVRRRDVSPGVRAFRRGVWVLHTPLLAFSLGFWALLAWVHRPWPLSRLDGPDNVAARAGFRAATGIEAPPGVTDIRYRAYPFAGDRGPAFLTCHGVGPETLATIVEGPDWQRGAEPGFLHPEYDGDLLAFVPSWFPADTLAALPYWHGPHEWTRLWYRGSDGTLVWMRVQ
jgi:hypothetical protein